MRDSFVTALAIAIFTIINNSITSIDRRQKLYTPRFACFEALQSVCRAVRCGIIGAGQPTQEGIA